MFKALFFRDVIGEYNKFIASRLRNSKYRFTRILNGIADLFQSKIPFHMTINVIDLLHPIQINDCQEKGELCLLASANCVEARFQNPSVIHSCKGISVVHVFQFFDQSLHFMLIQYILDRIADIGTPVKVYICCGFRVWNCIAS